MAKKQKEAQEKALQAEKDSGQSSHSNPNHSTFQNIDQPQISTQDNDEIKPFVEIKKPAQDTNLPLFKNKKVFQGRFNKQNIEALKYFAEAMETDMAQTGKCKCELCGSETAIKIAYLGTDAIMAVLALYYANLHRDSYPYLTVAEIHHIINTVLDKQMTIGEINAALYFAFNISAIIERPEQEGNPIANYLIKEQGISMVEGSIHPLTKHVVFDGKIVGFLPEESKSFADIVNVNLPSVPTEDPSMPFISGYDYLKIAISDAVKQLIGNNNLNANKTTTL